MLRRVVKSLRDDATLELAATGISSASFRPRTCKEMAISEPIQIRCKIYLGILLAVDRFSADGMNLDISRFQPLCPSRDSVGSIDIRCSKRNGNSIFTRGFWSFRSSLLDFFAIVTSLYPEMNISTR